MTDTIHMDFLASNEGSIILLYPESEAAKEWVAEYIEDDAQWFGNALAIEPHCFDPIAEALIEAGFACNFARRED